MGAFFSTLALMGVLDGLWLGVVARKFYRSQLGSLMAARPNWIAAGIFYLIFAVGVTYFVVNPAIADDRPVSALYRGAFFGLVAYATYDLTNQATIEGWSPVVTVVDMLWGAIMTAFVGFGAAYLMTRVFG